MTLHKKIKFYIIFFTLICNLRPGYGSGTVPEGLQRETEGFYYVQNDSPELSLSPFAKYWSLTGRDHYPG